VPDDATARFTRKGRATRARIVDVAAKLMFQRGVAGTSIEEVRNTAAVSGSQISHYFHDKRDLTRKVISARSDDVREFHSQPRLGALDSIKGLQAWAEANIADIKTVYRKGGCVYGSLAGELVEADAEIHGDLAAGYDQWIELFRAGLAEMRRRGDLRPDADPRHLAASLVAAHQGGALITYITDDPEPLRAAVTAAVEYVRSFAPTKRRRSTTSRRQRLSSRGRPA
jgi:AcrR family transcriptional regulator